MPAREPEQVDYLLADAFNAQDLDACVSLYDPEASVVRLDVFGGTVARGDHGIREVWAIPPERIPLGAPNAPAAT